MKSKLTLSEAVVKHCLALFVAMLMENLGYNKKTIDEVVCLIKNGK